MGEDTIVTLGPAGTNSHEVASRVNLELFRGGRKIIFAEDNSGILSAVRGGYGELGIVPVVNGSAGPVMEVIKWWMQASDDSNHFLRDRAYPKNEKRVFVNGVRAMPIKHQLLVSEDVERVEELETIVSHPQAILQCSKALKKWGLPTKASTSTAEAAASIVRSGEGCRVGAIASKFAAETHGLKILVENIEDNPDNATQFYQVSRTRSPKTGKDRTALLFWLPNESGALNGRLAAFTSGNINMRSLHSIPLGKLAEVAFYVEIDGHEDDPIVRSALTLVASGVEKLVIMGSYPQEA